MGTNLPNAGAPLGATHRVRRIVFVIIEAPPRFKICARDMRAGGQSTRPAKPMSTRTDDDVESPTDDVGRPESRARTDRTARRRGPLHFDHGLGESPATHPIRQQADLLVPRTRLPIPGERRRNEWYVQPDGDRVPDRQRSYRACARGR